MHPRREFYFTHKKPIISAFLKKKTAYKFGISTLLTVFQCVVLLFKGKE